MRYNPQKIEAKWQKKWLQEKIYEPDLKKAKRPFYNLMMFPYPSAEGLHVGNMYAFTGADIYGRFKRMQGLDVFEPIGLDGFGIHSENYALKIGRHPAEQAKVSEKNFYRQLQMLGNGFAWKEKLETYDPAYYKWTQWIFVQMYKRGLAYRKKASVNWCPSCMTVLADEQVIQKSQIPNPKSQTNSKSQIQNSKYEIRTEICERCDTAIVKKELEQWFFRITDYAERLLQNLEKIDWSPKIKIAQKNWIGKSEGALIKFPISNSQFSIDVFTTRPDTLFGATYMVLAPENELIANRKLQIANCKEVEEYIKKTKTKSEAERIAEGREKTGVELRGVKAINPANKEEIPVWVADYVLGQVGTGAIMAVPAHDQRDFEFAQKYNLPIKMVVCPHYPEKTCPVLDKAYEGGGHLVGSDKFDGLSFEEAKDKITEFVDGQKKIQYRLRDWLISRQRYWGPPIPMIYCDKCALRHGSGQGWQPVPEKDLPVKLPYLKNFRPTGTEKSPLASVEKFYKVRCPKCKEWARRETDVSDTFLDSAWYYIGYLAKENSKLEIRNLKFRSRAKRWLPIDMYIGGAEHAVLHLLYVRFLAMVFYDWGLLNFEEPFKQFRAHGLLIKDGAKMSKSRGNVVNPDDYIRAYGADALRMYLMFLGPFEHGGDFRDTGIKGITRFLERVYKLISNFKFLISKQIPNSKSEIQKTLHQTIKKVTGDIENLQYNTAISALMVLLNAFEENKSIVTKEDIKIFLRLLAPFAPHITEELWQNFSSAKKFRSIHHEKWPVYDPQLIKEDTFELVIQVNGKVRGRAQLSIGATEAEAKKVASELENIRSYLQTEPRKIIFVPDKLINFVV